MMSNIKENSKGFVKRVSEACPACLLNMVQGDLFAITSAIPPKLKD